MTAKASLEEAFYEELRDVLSAEKQITEALPKMAERASHPKLKAGFQQHLAETETQIERLKRVFELLGKTARAKKCEGMEGLLSEGEEILESEGAPEVIDALLIASAQKVEHYEIAAYGTLRTWAEQVGMSEAAQLLQETLDEESATDQKLTEIAQTVNRSAS